MKSFERKIVVVSGAAGNLGRAVVQSFLERGATVCALDYQPGRMDDLARGVEDEERLFLFEAADVRDPEKMQTLLQTVHQKAGSVDILVNTVGGFAFGEPVHALSAETWDRMMTLNVHSFLNMARAFVPDMIAAGGGKIITVGSKAALKGSAQTGAYAAAKSALLRLTESMALELAADQIQVNCVLPGTIDTPQNRVAMPKANPSEWVAPRQVAEVIVFLASSQSDAVSGAAVPVYGSP